MIQETGIFKYRTKIFHFFSKWIKKKTYKHLILSKLTIIVKKETKIIKTKAYVLPQKTIENT